MLFSAAVTKVDSERLRGSFSQLMTILLMYNQHLSCLGQEGSIRSMNDCIQVFNSKLMKVEEIRRVLLLNCNIWQTGEVMWESSKF